MIPRDYITSWRAKVPWVQDFQVEQDLVITRALVEIVNWMSDGHPGVTRDSCCRCLLSWTGVNSGTGIHFSDYRCLSSK
jgi:hypothetical protein